MKIQDLRSFGAQNRAAFFLGVSFCGCNAWDSGLLSNEVSIGGFLRVLMGSVSEETRHFVSQETRNHYAYMTSSRFLG